VTGYTLLALIAIAVALVLAYRMGAASARQAARSTDDAFERSPAPQLAVPPSREADVSPPLGPAVAPRAPRAEPAELPQLLALAEERRALFGALADAKAETARYRQIVIDIERNAPPPLLDAPGAPDDLKLIVGVGPVIERMLHQLGIGTFRQIARWSEREIDDIDARLREFPGRVRRDGWVTQARELHVSKYGAPP
jgi:predicted flap endonuclease-1-like 5' DNA nuclease